MNKYDDSMYRARMARERNPYHPTPVWRYVIPIVIVIQVILWTI